MLILRENSMKQRPYCTVIIVAAGKGRRMGTEISKQFLILGNLPVLVHTLKKFQNCDKIDEIIIVTGKDCISYCQKEFVEKYHITKVSQIIAGGKERQDSVYNGLKAVNEKTKIVAVHDGVRPFVKITDIEKTIKEAQRSKACALGVHATDTIKICNSENIIIHTPTRSKIWYIQTPQTFQYDILMKAYEEARKVRFVGTDEAMLVEKIGIPVKVVEGSYDNMKITTISDMVIGEALLKSINLYKKQWKVNE